MTDEQRELDWQAAAKRVDWMREYYFRGPYEGHECSMSGLPIAECGCVDCTLKRVGWERCKERRWSNLVKVVWEWARGLLLARLWCVMRRGGQGDEQTKFD